jgi:hypothetical protein
MQCPLTSISAVPVGTASIPCRRGPEKFAPLEREFPDSLSGSYFEDGQHVNKNCAVERGYGVEPVSGLADYQVLVEAINTVSTGRAAAAAVRMPTLWRGAREPVKGGTGSRAVGKPCPLHRHAAGGSLSGVRLNLRSSDRRNGPLLSGNPHKWFDGRCAASKIV